MEIELTQTKCFNAKYIKVEADVRYWEDAEINGVNDEDGDLTPFRNGDSWEPIIDIDDGKFVDWPVGMVASFHFKVCDAGTYHLLDNDKNIIATIDGYVPDGLCHGSEGYGDYIIMNVDSDGNIEKYRNKINQDDWNQEY